MRLGQTSFITFASQIVMSVMGFAANLVIANLLGPKIHGTYFLTVSLIYWLVLVGNMGLHQSIKKRVSESGSSSSIIAGALLVQTGLYVVVAGAILLFSSEINAYVEAPVAHWLLLMVLVTLANNFVVVLLDGQHKVHLSSLLTPVDWTIRSGIQIVLVVASVGLTGLFVGYLVGGVVAITIGLYFAAVRLEVPTWSDIRDLYSFAKYSWIESVKGRAFNSMDTVVLGVFVVNDLIGVYEIAWNLATLFAIFGFSINRTIFPEISSMASKNSERVREVVSGSLAYAGLFLIPGLVGAVLVGDVVLSIYGSAYTKGHYVLMVLIAARLVYAYLGTFLSTINALDKPEISFRIHLVFLVTNLVLNVTLISFFGWIGAAFATAISAAVGLLFGYWIFRRIVAVPLPLREIGRQVVAALVMGLAVYAGRTAAGDSVVVVVSLIILGGTLYFGTLTVISSQFRKTVSDNLPQSVPRL